MQAIDQRDRLSATRLSGTKHSEGGSAGAIWHEAIRFGELFVRRYGLSAGNAVTRDA